MAKKPIPTESENDVLTELNAPNVNAQLWMYRVGLGAIGDSYFREPNDNTSILAVGCRRIVGSFFWRSPKLVIERREDGGTVIADLDSGFKLECDSAAMF